MSTRTQDDPLGSLGDLFAASHDRPADLAEVRPDDLPAFARVLLITDGTVTHMLRAHYREPVDVFVETHEFIDLGEDNPWLEAKAGAPVLVRDVSIMGAETGRQFATARSWLMLDRMPEDMREDIVSMRRSIGNVLLARFSENRRELLWHGLRDGNRLERAYRVIAGGKPIMIISECFAPLVLES